jgi:hypothetical protein
VNRVRELEDIASQPLKRLRETLQEHILDIEKRGIPYESEPAPPNLALTEDERESQTKASFELQLLTEAFYYFASRVRTILKHHLKPIPGLTKFECVGVRNTRNHLIEHAEGKDSQIFIRSFAWGGQQGPVLKAVRYGGQEGIFRDKGLYENAEEFRSNLEKLLHAALPKT